MSTGLEVFLQQLADESRPMRSISLIALSDLGRDQLADFRLVWTGLRPARRLDLATALVEQAESDIRVNFHAVLRTFLSDSEAAVRRLAIEGLWEDEKATLIAPLTEMLARDPSTEVRAAAATSLGRFVLLGVLDEIRQDAAQAAEAALHLAWSRPGEPAEVRRRALEGLAYTDIDGLHELILNAYYDDDDGMRQSAIFAMGRNADPRWARLIMAELNSPEPAMRFEAAIAAGEMGLKGALQLLVRRLDDPDAAVREASVGALGKIGGPVARRALEVVAGGGDEVLASAAEEALGELEFASEGIDHVLLDLDEASPKQRRRDDWLVDEDEDGDEDDFLEGDDDTDFFDDDGDLMGEELDYALGSGDEGLDWDDEDEETRDQDWR